jgi:hypothetical protein
MGCGIVTFGRLRSMRRWVSHGVMRKAAPLVLLFLCTVLLSCKRSSSPPGTGIKVPPHTFDTVSFSPTSPPPPSSGPVPGVWVNTNMEVDGLWGGTVKTSKPYGLGIGYTDNASSFASAVITSVKVVYDDGTEEAGAKRLKLPIVIPARETESVNSMSGGRIMKSKVRVISTKIPGFIYHDEPFTLEIDGHFNGKTGGKTPFTINQHYEMKKDTGTRVLQDV